MNLRIVELTALLLCLSCGPELSPREPGQSRQSVLAGTADATHTGVVGLLLQHPLPNTNVGFCSAFMVSDSLVVTARHCVSGLSPAASACAQQAMEPVAPTEFAVAEGATLASGSGVFFHVRRVWVPDGTTGAANCGHDVAVLELAAPATGLLAMAPRLDGPPVLGETFTAVGYGDDGATVNDNGERRSRADARVESLGPASNSSAVDNDWTADLGPCGGDSGGPALGTDGLVIGVMSRGASKVCTHMVYTRLDTFAPWLRAVAVAVSADAGVALPGWASAADAGHPELDAGSDGGLGETDAGTPPLEPPPGAGCSASGASGLLPLLALLLKTRRGASRLARWRRQARQPVRG